MSYGTIDFFQHNGLKNTHEWNFKQNYIKEIAFEYVIHKMAAICSDLIVLTHWGRVTHIYVSNLTIIGSDNELAPTWQQSIIWTNAGILFIGSLGTNFSKIFNRNYNISIQETTFESVVCEMAAILFRPHCVNPPAVYQNILWQLGQ